MDEPLSNLDAELRHQMRNEIRRLHDELGTTTIYVTHDQIEAMTLADRIAILDKGELQQHCAPLDAYHNPANEFVRSFYASTSMIWSTLRIRCLSNLSNRRFRNENRSTILDFDDDSRRLFSTFDRTMFAHHPTRHLQ